MSVDVMHMEQKKKDPLQTAATALQIYSSVSNMGSGKAPKTDAAKTGQSSAMSRRYESSKPQYENSGSF